jgi:hypothetical protein
MSGRIIGGQNTEVKFSDMIDQKKVEKMVFDYQEKLESY